MNNTGTKKLIVATGAPSPNLAPERVILTNAAGDPISTKTDAELNSRYGRVTDGTLGRQNSVAGYSLNAIASDVDAGTIAGGGQVNYENIIGGDGSVTVNTTTPNVASMGTSANYGIIPGGYDNVAGGLASCLIGWHNYTALGITHGVVIGAANKVTSGDYGSVLGGQLNTVSGGAASVMGGQSNTASGGQSVVAGGDTNTASAQYSTVLGGRNNTASGFYSAVAGGYNTASAQASSAFGERAVAPNGGEFAQANGRFAADGDAQTSVMVVRQTTTTASFGILGIVPGTSIPVLPNNTTWGYSCRIVGRRTDAADDAHYELKGIIRRGANAAATALVGTPSVTVIHESDATWDVTAVADGTPGGLQIRVTGASGKTVRWVGRLEIVQVGG